VPCPLCRERKGKRACPAKGASICAPCCGTKRLVEIDCPRDCVYLTGAHAPAWPGRETERLRDMRRIAPFVQGLSETQGQLLMVALVGLTGIRAQRKDLTDRLVLDATQALRKTVETRGHGILYEHSAEDLRAQGLVRELRGLFEAKGEDGAPVSPSDADMLAVLAALEGATTAALKEGSLTEFLDTAARVASQMRRETVARQPPLIVAP
jgi:hypothetical protein